MSDDQLTESLTRYAPLRAGRNEAAAVIERYGIDDILNRHANGESLQAIADSIGVNARTLNAYVNQPVFAADYMRARELSAEVWADRGWKCLEMDGEEINSATVNRAHYKEMHCMKRAGIANARYSEKQQVELTGANGGPLQTQLVHVYVPANGRDEKIIDADTE